MKLRLLALASLLALPPAVHAGFIGVYDYMSSLGGSYAPQTGHEAWTFHNGDQNGALMGLYGSAGYGNLGAFAQFSSPRAPGMFPSGTAGTNEAAGIFTHTASSGITSAVFHADSSFLAQSFVFTYELVNNGNQGNGIDVSVRTVNGGNAVNRGTFTINNILSTQATFNFGSLGLQFDAGDELVVMFSARGSYLFDHGFWDVALREIKNPDSSSVPDTTATGALLALGLAALAAGRRRLHRA